MGDLKDVGRFMLGLVGRLNEGNLLNYSELVLF